MASLGIANEYWHNPRMRQVDEQSSKVYRYQVAGLIRGDRHIYTTDVLALGPLGRNITRR